jgi:hypothetical protein
MRQAGQRMDNAEKARMSLEATQEQRAAREVFASGADLALVAGAGTGKTSTLMMMAAATSKQGLYMAFNKTTAIAPANALAVIMLRVSRAGPRGPGTRSPACVTDGIQDPPPYRPRGAAW